MTTPTTRDIRAKLSDYLAGQASVTEFEDWFFPATWDIETTGDPEAQQLVWAVMTPLTEFKSDVIDQAELRRVLLPLTDNVRTHFEHTAKQYP